MTASISSPDFLLFMLKNNKSILINEDAENIIKSRDSKESMTQAFVNLLNLSDILLGDWLHQTIVATFFVATFNRELNVATKVKWNITNKLWPIYRIQI